MQIKYKIVEVHPQDHIIVARFYTDTMTEESLRSTPDSNGDGTPVRCRTDVSLSVPIPIPEEEELNKLILASCPVKFFETMEKINDPNIDTSMTTLLQKKNQEMVTDLDTIKNTITVPNTKKDLTDSEIEELLSKL